MDGRAWMTEARDRDVPTSASRNLRRARFSLESAASRRTRSDIRASIPLPGQQVPHLRVRQRVDPRQQPLQGLAIGGLLGDAPDGQRHRGHGG